MMDLYNVFKSRKCVIGVFALNSLLLLSSCGGGTPAPQDTEYLPDFVDLNFAGTGNALQKGNLALYVDYSTCMATANSSDFFRAIEPSFDGADATYYSIKGKNITKEDGRPFDLFRTIQEVQFADIKTAAQNIVDGNTEGALLTDGEYYESVKVSNSKGHVNDPYLKDVFKKWLSKGHDIYIISEPYDESGTDTNKNKVYHKKRFYFLFTDSRLQGNIYQRIVASVDLKKYPNVGVYHMSTSHPVVMTPDQTTTPSPNLAAKVEGRGGYEIQDWQVDWESIMDFLGAGAVDEKTGQPLPNGAPLITGLNIDREVYGCFRIKNIKLKVYDIDNAYFDYYTSKSAHTRAGVLTGKLSDYELQNAFTFDSKLFKKTGRVAILLDPSFDPSMLTGDPFNYIKIDVCVDGVENVFENNEKFFYFDSVDNSAKTNTSLSESVKQCLVDPSIQHSMDGTVIYSIYIKSNKN
jgi:hypothetical protein